MRGQAQIVGYAAAVLGVVFFAVGWGLGDSSVVQAAGAVAVAGIALLGVAAGLTTWHEEREKAREREQRETYATLVLQLVARFAAGLLDLQEEARVRSRVAVWADKTVLEALGNWHQTYERHVPRTAGPQFIVSEEGRVAFQKATAEVAHAVRRQLSPKDDNVSVDVLVRALFNYPRQDGDTPGQRASPPSTLGVPPGPTEQ